MVRVLWGIRERRGCCERAEQVVRQVASRLHFLALISASVAPAFAHYRFNSLIINGAKTPEFQYVRKYDTYNQGSPVTNLGSVDVRCNVGGSTAVAGVANVAAGSTIGFAADQTLYHPGVLNVYLAKAPGNVASWDGSGSVWFKIYQISAVTDGGKTITWPSSSLSQVSFKIPSSLAAGQYLVRVEHIGLHSASGFQGAQFYIACANLNVTGGGSSSGPASKVSFPGVYSGSEPGIQLNIYYPIPGTYTQPGPAVWSG